jgi:sialidase-1
MRRSFWIAASFSVAVVAVAAGSAEDIAKDTHRQDLFTCGANGYKAYRIPALVVTVKGTLLAFCEGRKDDIRDHGDIDLVLRRSTDGGKTWSQQAVVHEEGDTEKITIGNPCPVVDRDTGTVWLAFCRNNRRVFMTHSDDDGKNWSKPAEITASVKNKSWGWYATGPGHGIQLTRGKHKGRLVFPCDHVEGKEGRSHVFYSDDHGKTFVLGNPTEGKMNECEAAELSDGRLLLSMRNALGKSRRAFSVSKDGGATWSEPKANENVYCPTCQSSIHRYSWKPSILLYSGPGGPGRRNMTVRASYDEGGTWPDSRVVDLQGSGYSDLAVLPDGTVCCLFESGWWKPIVFVKFPLKWLKAGKRQ